MTDEATETARLRSWAANADAWTASVREGRIRSRVEVTDDAVLRAVLSQRPAQVLDLGCGEGWLVRELVRHGTDARGIDATEALVARARELGDPDRYEVATYDDLASAPSTHGPVDLVVSNFALFGESSTARVVAAVPELLADEGRFVIQTAHPSNVADPTSGGWRPGSWEGFGDEFTDPTPWYFRTKADWVALLNHAGLTVGTVEEPRDGNGRAASLLLIAHVEPLRF